MARRVFEKWTPKTVRGIGSVEFFKSDVDYIQTHGYSVAAVMREALHDHVLDMQKKETLPLMDKATRESFVMRGAVPRGAKYTEKKDPGVYFNPDPVPRIKFDASITLKPSAAERMSWTKEQRDRYILIGEIPQSGLAATAV